MSGTPRNLSDDELLRGLWWGDPEFEPMAMEVWRDYLNAKVAFDKLRSEYATVLRYFERRASEKPYSCQYHAGQLLQVPGGCPACAMNA